MSLTKDKAKTPAPGDTFKILQQIVSRLDVLEKRTLQAPSAEDAEIEYMKQQSEGLGQQLNQRMMELQVMDPQAQNLVGRLNTIKDLLERKMNGKKKPVPAPKETKQEVPQA